MFETTIAANPDACRTEAEIADESGNRVAIVYEDSEGWHTEICDDRIEPSSTSFKAVLSHYVNRRGNNLPSGLMTVGALALWLMAKDDGTVMGQKR